MKNKTTAMSRIIDGVSGIFLPIVNLFTAAGILKGILAALVAAGVITQAGENYLVLNAVADSLFYFLPMLLAYTAAKKFGANPFIAMVIAGILLYPSLTGLFEAGTGVRFFGIPIKPVIYKSSVIPIIMAAGLLKFVEQFFNKLIPELLKGFLVPLFSIVIVGFVTLMVFGPVGAFIGDVLAAGYDRISQISPVLAGSLLGAVIQPMVIFGFHWSFALIGINNVSQKGFDTVAVFMAPATFAQAGAALAVLVKTKNKKLKSLCVTSALSAFFGVTEPVMFGVNLPLKKPMLAVCLGGAVGGAIAGFSGATAVAFVFPSIVTLPVFLGPGFGLYLVSCGVGFAVSFITAMLLRFEADLPV